MAFSHQTQMQPFIDRLMERSALTIEQQQAILALPARRVVVRARQDFVHEDDETGYCSLIVSGLVGRFGQLKSGARQTTAFHIAGDMADLHSAMRPAGVGGLHALVETTVLRVRHSAIRDLAMRHPAIGEALWRDCMVDAAVLMQWVVNVGRREAVARLAHIFCEMSIRYGDDRETMRHYDFPVTQEQLGEAAALTSIHVNRTLKLLRQEGLVTAVRGRVTIHDWARLVNVGDFDATYLVSDLHQAWPRRMLATA